MPRNPILLPAAGLLLTLAAGAALAQFTGTAEVVESVPQEASSADFRGVQVPGESLGGQQSTEGDFTGSGGSDPRGVAPDGRPEIFGNGFEG